VIVVRDIALGLLALNLIGVGLALIVHSVHKLGSWMHDAAQLLRGDD
jgi:hypothetical protein